MSSAGLRTLLKTIGFGCYYDSKTKLKQMLEARIASILIISHLGMCV